MNQLQVLRAGRTRKIGRIAGIRCKGSYRQLHFHFHLRITSLPKWDVLSSLVRVRKAEEETHETWKILDIVSSLLSWLYTFPQYRSLTFCYLYFSTYMYVALARSNIRRLLKFCQPRSWLLGLLVNTGLTPAKKAEEKSLEKNPSNKDILCSYKQNGIVEILVHATFVVTGSPSGNAKCLIREILSVVMNNRAHKKKKQESSGKQES